MGEHKKRIGLLILTKIAYFPLALLACCQLAFWASIGTDTFLMGDSAKLSGGHWLASAAVFFVLAPIWFFVFAIACLIAFFRYRKRTPVFMSLVAILAALSVSILMEIK